MHILVLLPFLFAQSPGAGGASDPWEKAISGLKAPELRVRKSAAESLLDLASGLARSLPAPDRQKVLPTELKAILRAIQNREEDPQLRWKLLQVVGQLARGHETKPFTKDIFQPVLALLQDEHEARDVRIGCVEILPDLGGPPDQLARAIIAACQSPEPNLRAEALNQSGRVISNPDVLLPILDQALGDPSFPVRIAATAQAGALMRTDRRALGLLLRAAHDKIPLVQQGALIFLHQRGTLPEIKAELLRLLKDPAPGPRTQAAALLLRMDQGEKEQAARAIYEETAIAALRSSAPEQRERALEGLMLSGPEARATIPALKECLKDRKDAIRIKAAYDLIRITGETEPYLPILKQGITSPDPVASFFAAGALDILQIEPPEQKAGEGGQPAREKDQEPEPKS